MLFEVLQRPWQSAVSRVVVHVPHYLSHSGEVTSGGRQRTVRDISRLIRERWGRDVVILQKGRTSFETLDPHGTPVVGFGVPLNVWGDPAFGLATKRFLKPGDGVLTLGQEDAWPFFVKGAKAIHTGVWWDGPHSIFHRMLNAERTLGLIEASRSVWSVDTNLINWVRAQGLRGFNLVRKIKYEPNCVDLDALPPGPPRAAPNSPLRILFARRYEYKRGGLLLLDALKILKDEGFPFLAVFSLAEGEDGTGEVYDHINSRGLSSLVDVRQNDMNGVMGEYSSADVAIVPTLWSEGTSYSCIEAISAGVPPIVTPVGGLGNLVVPGFNGLVTAPAAGQLAKSIREIAVPTTWRRLHLNCLAMRESFSKAAWDERILSWLAE